MQISNIPPNTRRALCIAISAAAMMTSQAAAAGDYRASKKPLKDQYIVVLKQDGANRSKLTTADAARRFAENRAVSMVAEHGGDIRHVYTSVVNGFSITASADQIGRILADPRVAYVEQDSVVSLNATVPANSWGLDRIDQRALPLAGTYIYDTTGKNVHAYVVDSGMLTSHREFLDSSGNSRIGNGMTSVIDGRGLQDCNGHGTHVAGTIGGRTYGVARSVILHPIRAFDCYGSATTSAIVQALDWIRNNHVKPAVVNMSFGGPASDTMDAAVDNLVRAGVVAVAAAGNNSADACPRSPARVDRVITVGSTDNTDNVSSFSNYGRCVDIYAPGRFIVSAWNTGVNDINTISGTSMASPHVAGAAALYLQTSPQATPAVVADAIIRNATGNLAEVDGAKPPLFLFSRTLSYGSVCGRLNPGGALFAGQRVNSCDGRYFLQMQGDGNLVLYSSTKGALWATYRYGTGQRLVMQTDGNLVVYNSANQVRWNSATQGNPGAWLRIGNDGELSVQSLDARKLVTIFRAQVNLY